MVGHLAFKDLEAMIRAGDVDTVLTVFPDAQGRLMGKRVVGHYFLDHVAGEGLHACIYLFTVDIDMEPLPGFKLTSWEKGYGDFLLQPDLGTLRLTPWLERASERLPLFGKAGLKSVISGAITHTQSMRLMETRSSLRFGEIKALDESRLQEMLRTTHEMTKINRDIWDLLPRLEAHVHGVKPQSVPRDAA